MSLYSSTSSAMMDEIMGGAGNGNPVLTLAVISVLLIVVFGYLAFKSCIAKV